MRKGFVFLLVVMMLFAAVAVSAQDEMTVVAEGLNSPRMMTFAEDGTLYIADAGAAGEETAIDAFGSEVPVGFTSQIVAVSPEGEQSVAVDGLFSRDYFFAFVGAHKAIVTEDAVWVLYGLGVPAENLPEGATVSSLVRHNPETLEAEVTIDVGAFEIEANPDESPEDLDSNPVDFLPLEDGSILIVDASANALFRWTEADGLSVFAAWPVEENVPSAVPTSIELGPDGNFYVGFLGGFPFLRDGGTSRIEVWSPEGELVTTYGGTNLVTDVLVAEDGTIYAVEMAEGFGDAGYLPETGRVVTVSEDGVTAVAEGLNFPYGLAMDAEGNLFVNVNASYSAPGTAQVVMLPGM